MTWAPCSIPAKRMGARPGMAAIAVPKNSEKTTTCRISLSAMAFTTLVGIRWVKNPAKLKGTASTPLLSAAGGGVSCRPEPGWIRCTITKPISSDTRLAEMNHPMVLAPIRPTEAASSIWAMPLTRVVNTRIEMIILIRFRNMVVTTPKPSATCLTSAAVSPSWQAHPTATPKTMAATRMAVNKRFMARPGVVRPYFIGKCPAGPCLMGVKAAAAGLHA